MFGECFDKHFLEFQEYLSLAGWLCAEELRLGFSEPMIRPNTESFIFSQLSPEHVPYLGTGMAF